PTPRASFFEGSARPGVDCGPCTFGHLPPASIHTFGFAFPDDGPYRRPLGTEAGRAGGDYGLATRPTHARDGPLESVAQPHPRARRGEQPPDRACGPRLLHAEGRGGAGLLYALPRRCRALGIRPRGRHGRGGVVRRGRVSAKRERVTA